MVAMTMMTMTTMMMMVKMMTMEMAMKMVTQNSHSLLRSSYYSVLFGT